MAIKKCPLCKKSFDDIDALCNHIESKHSNEIPKGMSGGMYYFYSKHGRTTGKCIVCGKETQFDEVTKKPNRLCSNPNCKKHLRDNATNNMMKKYGKETLLNDPEFQKKMLDHRSISKDYKWSDGKSIKRVVGSYEYDAVQFLDIMMNFDPEDVIIPAPVIIDYMYDGKKHFYIPDIYISSLNLLVEIKDGGNNPNMHPKIQAVDKVKEKLKEDAIRKISKYNYVKIENKEYGIFIKTLVELKNKEDIKETKFTPIVMTNEMCKLLFENTFGEDLESCGISEEELKEFEDQCSKNIEDFKLPEIIPHTILQEDSNDTIYERLNELNMNLKPTINLSLDNDGSILIKKHDNVDFDTIYNNSHILLKEYSKARSYEAMKYELCKLWYMKCLIDNKTLYNKKKKISEEERLNAIRIKSFVMSDFKIYLRQVLANDRNFNFNEYFNKTQFGVEIYKIDKSLIQFVKNLIL